MSDEPVLAISEDAISKIQEIRDGEASEETLGLYLEITGVRGPQFVYELSFAPVSDAKPEDSTHTYNDDLVVIIAGKDAEKFEGATLSMGSDPANPSLSINNPNVPATPVVASAVPVGDLTGPICRSDSDLAGFQYQSVHCGTWRRCPAHLGRRWHGLLAAVWRMSGLWHGLSDPETGH